MLAPSSLLLFSFRPSNYKYFLLQLLAIIFTGWQLKDELSEFFTSRKNHQVCNYLSELAYLIVSEKK